MANKNTRSNNTQNTGVQLIKIGRISIINANTIRTSNKISQIKPLSSLNRGNKDYAQDLIS